MFQLPNGTWTVSVQHYLDTWRALAQPIADMFTRDTGIEYVIHGFDRDVCVVRKDRKGKVVVIRVEEAEKILIRGYITPSADAETWRDFE